MKKVMVIISASILGYVILGSLFHAYIFPEKLPDIYTYFHEDDSLVSTWEGLE